MKNLWYSLLILALATIGLGTVALLGQPPAAAAAPQLPLWMGGVYKYVTLSPAFRIMGNVIDVPVTQGPPGAPGAVGQAGAPGAIGPAGPQGTFTVAPNDIYVLTQAQAVFTLRCAVADIYWDEFMTTEGIEYSVATTNLPPANSVAQLAATFSPNTPIAGDVVKITYRCQ